MGGVKEAMIYSYDWIGGYPSLDDVKQDPSDDDVKQDSPKTTIVSYEYVGKWKILFGKYKNTIYEDVPTAYLKWCDENDIIKHEKVKGYIKERLSEK